MALSATLYRIKMELSDVDRHVYESLEFRVAQHPSEPLERVVARTLAYALYYEEELEFGKGVSDTDEPALWSRDLTGQITHWIEVGAPSAARVHLASKKSPRVTIVAHKGAAALSREMTKRKLHRAEEIEVLLIPPAFIKEAAAALTRTSDWTLVRTDDDLNLSVGEHNLTTTVQRLSLPDCIKAC